jgi:predicted PurR-regulated permease PerM
MDALAVLFTFLLTPVVGRLEHFIGRIAAVFHRRFLRTVVVTSSPAFADDCQRAIKR